MNNLPTRTLVDETITEYHRIHGGEKSFLENLLGQSQRIREIFIEGATSGGAILGDDMNTPTELFGAAYDSNIVIAKTIHINFDDCQNPDTFKNLVEPGKIFHMYLIIPPLRPLIKGQMIKAPNEESFEIEERIATETEAARSKMVIIRYGIQE